MYYSRVGTEDTVAVTGEEITAVPAGWDTQAETVREVQCMIKPCSSGHGSA